MEQDQEIPMEQPGQPSSSPMDDYQREQDRIDEAKHEAATLYAEKMCDMMGIEGDDERVKMVEGFRAVFGGGPRFPSGPVMIPKQPPPIPDSCCVVEKNGCIESLDWMCILSRTYKEVYHFRDSKMSCELFIYNKMGPVNLNHEQTVHQLKWLDAVRKWQAELNVSSNPYGISYSGIVRIPHDLLNHPAIQEFING